MIWVHDAHFTLSLSPLKKRIAVVKEKAPTETAKLFVNTTPKHKIAFSMLKFTVLSFGISRKAFEKAGKALKTAPFVSFRAKP